MKLTEITQIKESDDSEWEIDEWMPNVLSIQSENGPFSIFTMSSVKHWQSDNGLTNEEVVDMFGKMPKNGDIAVLDEDGATGKIFKSYKEAFSYAEKETGVAIPDEIKIRKQFK